MYKRKRKKLNLKTHKQSHLNFLLNKQCINHIDDYIASHIDDPIGTVPFLDLHQATLKEKQFHFMLKLFLHLVCNS